MTSSRSPVTRGTSKRAPRGAVEELMVANDCEQLRGFLDGVPADHVTEYVAVLGSVEAMRGVLDVYRNESFTEQAGDADADRLPPIEVPTLSSGRIKTQRSQRLVHTPPPTTWRGHTGS